MNDILEYIKNFGVFDVSTPLLFTQYKFWVFFTLVFAFFSSFHSRILMRNSFLFAASLFFYYKTSGLFVLILLFSTLSDYTIALRMNKSKTNSRRKAWMILSVIINLLVLSYFKYSYFLTEMVNQLLNTHFRVFNLFAELGNVFTASGRFDVSRIILPVGISFYTFQTISYSVDVFRRQIEPVKNILNFGFYVSFFPQLVAGPIVRASDFVPQITKPYFLSRRQFGLAVFWIMNGLMKKLILSDYLATHYIDMIFQGPEKFTGLENLLALFTYSLQVYADFSGYTDIAIGVAMLMGFYLPQNFNSPYKATNAAVFWKRWHMSLSSWLKDYLYIPLGGNRNATFGTYFWIVLIALIGVLLSGTWYAFVGVIGLAAIIMIVALLIPKKRNKIITNLNNMDTMLLGGLWHGASWNFMIWGGLNGLGIVIYKLWKSLSIHGKLLAILSSTLVTGTLYVYTLEPFWAMMMVWSGLTAVGTLIKWLYFVLGGHRPFKGLDRVWGIAQTFTFMSFTRLFFRSGSNLDPASANDTAWSIARVMVKQIGSPWQTGQIPAILFAHRYVLLVFVLGMMIHWIPDDFKRRYRLWFTAMPQPLMLAVCFVIIVFTYQFISAGFHPFIYFQF